MTFLEFQLSIALVMTTMCTQTSCTLDPGCTVAGLALYGHKNFHRWTSHHYSNGSWNSAIHVNGMLLAHLQTLVERDVFTGLERGSLVPIGCSRNVSPMAWELG